MEYVRLPRQFLNHGGTCTKHFLLAPEPRHICILWIEIVNVIGEKKSRRGGEIIRCGELVVNC